MKEIASPNGASRAKHLDVLQSALDHKKIADGLRVIRIKEVMRRLGLSRSTVYGLIESGQLNPPILLAARAVGWLESDITAFIESRINASRCNSKEAAA